MKLAKMLMATTGAAGALAGAAAGFGTPPAQADPPPPWAPRQPAAYWEGQPVVWWDGDPTPGGHWGVWINGQFLNLT